MKKGFTLIELLITIAIFLMIMAAVYSSFSLSQKASKESQDSAEITQNGRVIIEKISREIRQVKEIVGDFPDTRESAVSSIIFEDGHITDSYHYVHYFKSDGEIKREVLGFYFSADPLQELQPWDALPPPDETLETKTLEAEAVIGEWVEKLEFWGSDVVNISLTLTKKAKTLVLGTKIFCRNF